MMNDLNRKVEKKQNSELDRDAQKIKRDGFTAEEIGEASAYEDETETAQRMRRGDETKGNPNERDVVSVVNSDEVSPDVSSDKETTE